MKKTQILLVTPGSELGIDLLALPAGTGMAACSLWALPVQLHQLWWAQSWERTGTSASGHHPSLAELSELQCPSCLPSAAVLLAPALPKGFFYGERVWPLSLLAQHGSPGAELGAPGESLHSILSFPWFSASLWVSPLPFPGQLLLGSLKLPRILRPETFFLPMVWKSPLLLPDPALCSGNTIKHYILLLSTADFTVLQNMQEYVSS